MVLDAAAAALSWTLVGAVARKPGPGLVREVAALVLVIVATMVALGLEHLYRRRVTNVRSEEVARLARVAALSTTAAAAAGAVVEVPTPGATLFTGFLVVFLSLTCERGWFAQWLRDQRSAGRFVQPVLVVGDDEEAVGLVRLLEDCPEVGFRAVGVVADAASAAERVSVDEDPVVIVDAARRAGATGVLITSHSVESPRLNQLVRELHGARIHVHISSGLERIHRRRMHVQPIAHEPLLYIEAPTLSPLQLASKRALDVVSASVALALLAPVVVAAAIAIKLDDGGPVIFRQRRIGRDGRPFQVLKLRTMAVGAEHHVGELRDRNQRTGPLFKLDDDPRVTRVGRFLRESSIDEVPQLINVLCGEMSMVGPRPALPEEVEQFDEDLLDRLQVKPGVSGLWQVEARHKASFEQYRRLDLFYVENWSLALDLSIMLATVTMLLRRSGGAVSERPVAEVAFASSLTPEPPA